MRGRIIRGDSGFYYVYSNSILYECKLRGKLKLTHKKAYPGDIVEIIVDDNLKGSIESIEARKNLLPRPAIANSDQLLIVMSLSYPTIDFNVLDRLLVLSQWHKIEPMIVLNKKDEDKVDLGKAISEIYPFLVIEVSATTGYGLDILKKQLEGKLSVLAGPSGVGKSSILNVLDGKLIRSTGVLGDKLKRGRHTTRTSEFYEVNGGLIADTPGFSRLDLPIEMKMEDLTEYYPEFYKYTQDCFFNGCLHDKEKKCGVKNALLEGKINQDRYDRYIYMLGEIKENKERRYK
ncbi:MAG: ribosome small subunit-dependent GTPase A [Firmicutes bacterium]|nr:ribosome small subunit-dependent GTPase A [Bacillota bacterium]